MSDNVAAARGRHGGALSAIALAALAIAGYLALVKLTGGAPACAVVSGCEVVNDSQYATVAGVPVAVLGFVASLATLAGTVRWWRSADPRGLYLAYTVGLLSLPVLVWLTYLELAVIHAVCVWCVTYAVAVVAGWLVAAVTVRGIGR